MHRSSQALENKRTTTFFSVSWICVYTWIDLTKRSPCFTRRRQEKKREAKKKSLSPSKDFHRRLPSFFFPHLFEKRSEDGLHLSRKFEETLHSRCQQLQAEKEKDEKKTPRKKKEGERRKAEDKSQARKRERRREKRSDRSSEEQNDEKDISLQHTTDETVSLLLLLSSSVHTPDLSSDGRHSILSIGKVERWTKKKKKKKRAPWQTSSSRDLNDWDWREREDLSSIFFSKEGNEERMTEITKKEREKERGRRKSREVEEREEEKEGEIRCLCEGFCLPYYRWLFSKSRNESFKKVRRVFNLSAELS